MIREKDLPKAWKIHTLEECCNEKPQYGSGASAIKYKSNLPRYIRITDIDENGNLKNDSMASPSIIEYRVALNKT